jgi:glucose-1-phosphate thymidylyltransferase
MKGIVLAAGRGSRLWPATYGVSKHLLAIYDKPLIHYPISTLMLAGIQDILLIVNESDLQAFKRTLGDGSQYGLRINYAIQQHPNGIAEAFLIAEDFIDDGNVCLILGDNIFYGQGLGAQLNKNLVINGAHVFAYKVSDPNRYGVIEFDGAGKVISIEEKPKKPKSSFAIPGLYFYDNSVIEKAKKVVPSARGEKEITSINAMYLNERRLYTSILERGTAWLDTGTFESMFSASSFIKVIEERQGLKVSCLEEIAWRNGWISDNDLWNLSRTYESSPYADYLANLLLGR